MSKSRARFIEDMHVSIGRIRNVLDSDNTEDEARKALREIYRTIYLDACDVSSGVG